MAALVSLDRIGLAPTSGPPHVLLLLPGMSTRRRPPGSVPHFLHLCVQVPPSQCGLPWPSDFPVEAPLSCKAPVPSGFDFVSRTYHHLTQRGFHLLVTFIAQCNVGTVSAEFLHCSSPYTQSLQQSPVWSRCSRNTQSLDVCMLC